MKKWFLFIISAIGSVLGVLLSEAGGPWIDISKKVDNTKIEQYWHQTGLGARELTRLVSNEKCKGTEKYYQACLNMIIEGSLYFKQKISAADGRLIELNRTDFLDEKSEKELLQLYSGKIKNIDFDKILSDLVMRETEIRRPLLYAHLINAFLSVYVDPHTYIVPEKFYNEVSSKIKRSKYFVGISYEKTNGMFYIRKIFKNSDAETSGLKNHDKILSVNSVNLKNAPYADLSQILKNEDVAILKFKVKRNNKIIHIDLKRSYQQLSHVQFNRYRNASDNKNYGLLTLTKFNSNACALIAEHLKNFKKNQLDGLVLDLRDNPGGQLDEAACIGGLFLGKNKLIYSVEYFDKTKEEEVVLSSRAQAYDGPLVVLVNGSSASASELLAGTLQEYGRALVMGERTFGKGTFQEPEVWTLNSKINLFKTQGLYLLPSGNSTQLRGIQPDVELLADVVTKREGQTYFNPVLVESGKYLKQKKPLQQVFVYNRCKRTDQINFEDLYLQEGFSYLKCAKSNVDLAVFR